MFKFLSKLLDINARELKKLQIIIDEINKLESKIKKLRDKDFPEKTKELKNKLSKGKT